MPNPLPTIQKFMTPTPRSIPADRPLAEAIAAMHAQRIRHLPVLRDGKLTGILSDRDVRTALGIRGVDPRTTTVEEVAETDVCIVSPDAPVDEVAARMAERRIDCAVVVRNHQLVGIFTSTDALRIVGERFGARD